MMRKTTTPTPQPRWEPRTLPVTIATTILALVLCSLAQAQQPSLTEEKSGETKTGSISGKVVNENGQPLANAAVIVRAVGTNNQSRTTITDGNGAFQLSGLDPLAYLISASLPAYAPAPRDPDSPQPGYFHLGDSARIELIKGAVISGTVTSPSGEPLVSVRVRAYVVRDGSGTVPRYDPGFKERTTDDRGFYRIYGLAPGTYIVSAGGRSTPGSYLSMYDSDAPIYSPASTRDTAAEFSLRPGEEVTNADIRYRAEPGHIVSGSASGGIGARPYTIRLNSNANGMSQLANITYQLPGSRGFSFSGVGDGDYDLTAMTSSATGDVTVSEYRRIKVKGADVTGLDLPTGPLGSISGRVLLEASRLPECAGKRRPVFAETVITPWHNEKNLPKDQPQFLWAISAGIVPDKQGEFTLRNLAPGQYRFHTRSLARYWYLQSISLPAVPAAGARTAVANQPRDAARNWTTVKSGERLAGLVITFAEGAASFHGQIKLAEGQKLEPKLFVYLVPAEREKAEDILRFFAAQVGADGSFALNNLPPGRYQALAKSAGESESNILSRLRLPDETTARAKLRVEAEAAKTEIELKPCQNVTDYQLPPKP